MLLAVYTCAKQLVAKKDGKAEKSATTKSGDCSK